MILLRTPVRHDVALIVILWTSWWLDVSVSGLAPVTTLSSSSSSSSSGLSSIGERLQQAQSVSDLLQVAQDLWLPTDDNLAPHLLTQRIHHEKRLRWSAQLLGKMGGLTSPSDRTTLLGQDGAATLARAILASSIPFQDDRPEKEGRYIREALVGLHNVLGYMAVTEPIHVPDILVTNGILQLVQRANDLAPVLPLPEVAEIRWACLGIFARCSSLVEQQNQDDSDPNSLMHNLNDRVSALPFDLIPKVVDWNEIFPSQSAIERLQDEIPFHFDTIVTRTGAAVIERRGTSWIAEPGIGALAYSGKLMPPHPISEAVRSIMRRVEEAVLPDNHPRPFFDCALCNHYPDGESSCKFHTDPEHGTHWERLNCVVAAGSPRRFAFRPIPGHSTWSEWEPVSMSTVTPSVGTDPHTPAVITLFPGDVAQMWGTCNDDFHHAVYPGQERPSEGGMERISLVLKRSIPRGGGLRGHRLAGEGRRARRKATSPTVQSSRPMARGKSTPKPGGQSKRSKR